ncbi:MAG: tetratricopeptide repeat protein [Opitutales bacterium]|nr:tetratricopeptide repeat protein [Opitutales bacterium]
MNHDLQAGIQLHESGDREGALRKYLFVWEHTRKNASAAYLIGLIYHEQDNPEEAKKWLNKSIQCPGNSAHCHNLIGEIERKSERYDEAHKAFRKAIKENPKMHQAYFGLAQTWVYKDRLEEALKNFHQAIRYAPTRESYWEAYIHTLNSMQRTDEAFKALEQALIQCRGSLRLEALRSQLSQTAAEQNLLREQITQAVSLFRSLIESKQLDQAEALIKPLLEAQPLDKTLLYNYAVLLVEQEQFDRALQVIDQLFALGGDIPRVWVLKAQALTNLERFEEALQVLDKVLQQEPENFDALFLKGLTYKEMDQDEAALPWLLKAYQLFPENTAVLVNTANILLRLERYKDAGTFFSLVLKYKPDLVEGHLGLAAVAYHTNRENDPHHLRRSFELCRKAIEMAPHRAYPHINLGSVLLNMVLIDEAIDQMRLGYDRITGIQEAYSSLVFHSNYSSSLTPQEIADLHTDWSKRFEADVYVDPKSLQWDVSADPHRKLRIGILSGDLHFHPVSYFMEPVLKQFDRNQFELVAFSSTRDQDFDPMTDRLKEYFTEWHDIRSSSDSQVATLSRNRQVDIVIDLSGHTGKQRLMALAYRMAPLQVEWLGYPNTTGLKSMDYRFTDAITEPEGEADEWSSEKLIRLPQGFHVFKPFYEFPPVAPAPWETEGYITFGSFNNVRKITPQVIALWARILKQVPQSRLYLKDRNFDYEENRSRVISLFVLNGISAKRLIFHGMMASNAAHLNAYSKVDIALDPFPYNGTTTSCEALYMGLPVVTLQGNRHAARVTSSILTHVGRPQWIAQTEDDYVRIACELASDPQYLSQNRKVQRQDFQQSPLADVSRFTCDMEQALRKIWVDWCAENQTI